MTPMRFVLTHSRQCRVLLVVALLAVPVLQAIAGNTYIYRENDGTIWYTNKKPVGVEHNKYKLIGIFGRPTATQSCHGMTPARMEQRARLYADDISSERVARHDFRPAATVSRLPGRGNATACPLAGCIRRPRWWRSSLGRDCKP